MKKYIKAASDKNEALDEALADIKADFDYIIDGLEKLDRDGNGKEALTIALDIRTDLMGITGRVTSAVGK